MIRADGRSGSHFGIEKVLGQDENLGWLTKQGRWSMERAVLHSFSPSNTYITITYAN